MEAAGGPAESTHAGPRCARCGTPIVWSGNPVRPFCSHRCKLIDAGRWLDEEYRIPGPSIPPEPVDGGGPPDE